MIKSYILIAWRNLVRYKLFSFINIFGLAIGITVCILAIIDVRVGYNYDKFHSGADKIFRLNTVITDKENHRDYYASAPYPLGQQLNNRYSFIEHTVQAYPVNFAPFKKNGNEITENIYFTGTEFLKVFGFKMLSGRLQDEPRTAVLTEATAKRFFGNENPIGRYIHHKTWGDITVTGVLKNTGLRSHLEFDMLVSLSTIPLIEHTTKQNFKTDDQTNAWSSYTYVKLKRASQIDLLNSALKNYAVKASGSIKQENPIKLITFEAQDLRDITPSGKDYLNFPSGPTLGKLIVEILVGLVTLFLALFNYINLTLARSLTRSREVGIRKVIGAQRWQLILQFVSESVIISLGALLLSCVLLQFVMGIHAKVVQQILNDAKWDLPLMITLVIFAIITGLCAGIIPARVLSSFKPALALKSQTGQPVFRRFTLRKILMVTQFTVSFVGIVFMIVMYRQSVFSATTDLGFKAEHIINIDIDPKDRAVISSEIAKVPGVERISATSAPLGFNGGDRSKAYDNNKSRVAIVDVIYTDGNYVKNMGLSLTNGSNLDNAVPENVLINQKALGVFGFKNAGAAVNEQVWLNDSTRVRIAGVLKDFHESSVNFPIAPLVLKIEPDKINTLQIKVSSSGNPALLMAQVKNTLKKLYPKAIFNAQWFGKQLYEQHLHRDDQVFLGILIGMALSIACMGLLGMVTYTTQVRVKEIGIRKVMGAGVLRIVYLISADFVKLLLIASLIAIPAGMIIGVKFLQHFAYHIQIGFGTAIGAFGLLMFIGALTIAWQAIKAASANPVDSLRNE